MATYTATVIAPSERANVGLIETDGKGLAEDEEIYLKRYMVEPFTYKTSSGKKTSPMNTKVKWEIDGHFVEGYLGPGIIMTMVTQHHEENYESVRHIMERVINGTYKLHEGNILPFSLDGYDSYRLLFLDKDTKEEVLKQFRKACGKEV